jgi:hypothetical protein
MMTRPAFLAALALLASFSSAFSQSTAPPSEPAFEPIKQQLQPADYLDSVGQQTKTLWRKLYRDAPPTPSADRYKVAFTLGGLIADCYLTLQASDAQKFKDTNQDVKAYVTVLGIGEKLSPALLSESKMAETQDWLNTRRQVGEIETQVEKLLVAQRDEDLAVLVNLGMWMRLFEITTTVFMADPELTHKSLCVGSVSLLDDLKARYDKLSATAKQNDPISRLGANLDLLQRHWSSAGPNPSQELVQLTAEKIAFIMGVLQLPK